MGQTREPRQVELGLRRLYYRNARAGHGISVRVSDWHRDSDGHLEGPGHGRVTVMPVFYITGLYITLPVLRLGRGVQVKWYTRGVV
jgi:hypothetical protein